MKTNNHWHRWLIGVLCIGLSTACSDEWEKHYDRESSLPTMNLWEQICMDDNLSSFARAIKLVGADTLLTSNQTYTVWAPLNEALQDIDFDDVEQLRRMVRNHVARYASPSSTPISQRIYMLNGKPMGFENGKYAGVVLAACDIRAANGILHKLEGLIPYKYNILEYISVHPEYSCIHEFISRFDEKIYDASLSTTYDSIFTDYNRLLQDTKYGVGSIGDEDSLYTMIIPDNAAWESTFSRISPYFRSYNKDEKIADSVQVAQTSLAILGGLTFQGKVSLEASDTLQTIAGNTICNVADYFNGYEVIEASNGVIYLAQGVLNANDTCVWNHKIILEAEDMDHRQNLSGTNSYIRTTDINSLVSGVSEDGFLEVSSGNVDGGVIFDIANTLAGTYDIYVDFVSPIVDGKNLSTEKTKVTFQLKYLGDNGRSTVKNNNTATEISADGSDGIITIKAFAGMQLPVSNYYDGMWYLEEENIGAEIAKSTTLQVKTKVTNSDAKKGYVRKFRVDRVRFVPVITE